MSLGPGIVSSKQNNGPTPIPIQIGLVFIELNKIEPNGKWVQSLGFLEGSGK